MENQDEKLEFFEKITKKYIKPHVELQDEMEIVGDFYDV